MTSNTFIRILAGAALATAMMTVGANAQYYPYASTAGTLSGVDAFGNPWTFGTTTLAAGPDSPGPGDSAWGTPGLGDGTVTYGGALEASDFTVSFAYFVDSAILQTPSPFAGGYNEFTRFDVETPTGYVEWTAAYDGTKSVTFTSPGVAADLTLGEQYFVNVVFDNGLVTGHNTGMTASFSVVPEPATWVMLGLGFAAVGAAGVSRRKTARYAI